MSRTGHCDGKKSPFFCQRQGWEVFFISDLDVISSYVVSSDSTFFPSGFTGGEVEAAHDGWGPPRRYMVISECLVHSNHFFSVHVTPWWQCGHDAADVEGGSARCDLGGRLEAAIVTILTPMLLGTF